MDTENIFGPLTFRQFLYLAVALGICLTLNELYGFKSAMPYIIVIAGISLALILNAPKVVIDEAYLKMKKETTNPELFDRWVKMKKAMVESQVVMRKERNAAADPKLDAMLELFERFSVEKDGTN